MDQHITHSYSCGKGFTLRCNDKSCRGSWWRRRSHGSCQPRSSFFRSNVCHDELDGLYAALLAKDGEYVVVGAVTVTSLDRTDAWCAAVPQHGVVECCVVCGDHCNSLRFSNVCVSLRASILLRGR
eukprot:PhF_6_TR11578/c1_g1_i2/m.18708